MKTVPHSPVLIVLLTLLLAACAPTSRELGIQTPPAVTIATATQPQISINDAQVSSVEVQVAQTDPLQVNAIVRGNLSDSCTHLGDTQTTYAEDTFQIKLVTVTPSDQGCVQIISPYEQTIPLDTTGLTPGTYTVVANGVSAVFTIPGEAPLPPTSLQLVVRASNGSLQVANLNLPLNPTARPTFNGFLPSGGSAEGNAYVLDNNAAKAVVTDGKGFQDLVFVQSPTPYGLAVWPGDAGTQPRLAWATQNIGGDTSSTIKISNPDGTQFDTLLTQDAVSPPVQLMAQFFSADGQWLYFSKEPMGIGGYILFGGGSSLYKINVTTKEIVDVIPTDLSEEPVACLDAVSADLHFVAEHCSQNFIRIRDLISGGNSIFNPPAAITTGHQLAGSARFSPDGKKLAYAVAKSVQDDEQGWVVVSDTAFDDSKVILTSPEGRYYTIAGWLDDQALLVESTNPLDCSPYCTSELWTVMADGTGAQKVADGSFLAVIPNDAIIQLPAGPTPTSGSTACTDSAEYVGDDGMDETTYTPNTSFTKTWTVKNTGTCTWDSRYLVYQISGAFMTQQPGYWLVAQGEKVEPGQDVDISIGMTSPPGNGKYRSDWVLKDAQEKIIPLKGGTDENSFYVEIKVDDGTAHGNVTASAIDISLEQGSGEVCTANATYFVHAYVSTDGPAVVPYEIGSSAGQISAGYFDNGTGKNPYVAGELNFDKADTKQINLRFVGPYPYPDDITVMLRVAGGEWYNSKLLCP